MPEDVATSLISHGPIGVLCLGLAYGLRMMWLRYDEAQKARLAEREILTKALLESTVAIREMTEYLARRRGG